MNIWLHQILLLMVKKDVLIVQELKKFNDSIKIINTLKECNINYVREKKFRKYYIK